MKKLLKIYLLLSVFFTLLMACDKKEESTQKPCGRATASASDEVTYDLQDYWVLMYRERKVEGCWEKEYQRPDNDYPITLELYDEDSLYGRHDVIRYWGEYVEADTSVSFNVKYGGVDVYTGEWYEVYQTQFRSLNRYEVRNGNTLRLYNEADTLSYYFWNKARFEQEFFDLDTLYTK